MLLNGGLEKAALKGMPKLPVHIANTLFVGFNHAGRLETQNPIGSRAGLRACERIIERGCLLPHHA